MSAPFPDFNDNKHNSLETSYLKWISRQMEKRVIEYSDSKPVTIFCGTWNVNARELPESCDLNEWIFPPGSDLCDIYVIGLQEMVDLNVMNVVLNSRSSDDMSSYWVDKLTKLLNGSKNQYSVVQEKHMVGVEFIIFAKDDLFPHIYDIRSAVVFTGGRGLTGNKGGISIRMDVYDSSLCFVCAHFHADRNAVEARNLDFQTIMDNTSLVPYSTPTNSWKLNEDENVFAKHHGVALSILNHEQVFWLGDLNYRISDEIETTEVFEKVVAGEWDYLRSRDQLLMERAKGNVFQGFEEGLLTFPPTYKYQPGTDIYEQRPNVKLRAPAWCDRVLWRCADKTAVKQLRYQRAPLNASDHKPVCAIFTSNIRKIIPSKMKAIYQDLLFSVDKWINASAPKIQVDGRIIDAGLVSTKEKFKSKITIQNVGSVMAEWQFVPKNDELLICKPWIKLYPTDGILAPNETAEVEVTIDLTVETAYEVMNTPKDSDNDILEDIFVLHSVKGSDFFCIVSGKIDPQTLTEVKCSEYAVTRKLYETNSVFQKKESASGTAAPVTPLQSKRSSISLLVSPVPTPKQVVEEQEPSFDDIYGKGDADNF